jgi:hypothetical protein
MIKIDRIFIIRIFFRILEYSIFALQTWVLDVGEKLLIYLFYHQKSVRLLTNLAILLRFVIRSHHFSVRVLLSIIITKILSGNTTDQ